MFVLKTLVSRWNTPPAGLLLGGGLQRRLRVDSFSIISPSVSPKNKDVYLHKDLDVSLWLYWTGTIGLLYPKPTHDWTIPRVLRFP